MYKGFKDSNQKTNTEFPDDYNDDMANAFTEVDNIE